MDKELQKAKEEYQGEITFTDNDRNKVLEKISESKLTKPSKGIFHPFPVISALIATLLIGFLFLTNTDLLVNQNSGSPEDKQVEGYIVKIEDNEALVTNSDTQQSIWLSDIPEEFEIGQKIQGSYDNSSSTQDSPTLNDFEIKPSHTIEGSNMTEEEVIRTALTTEDYSRFDPIMVRSVEYEPSTQVWTIQLSLNDRGDWEFNIDDQTQEIMTEHDTETSQEPVIEEIINEYEDTITSLKNDDTQQINFDTKEELKNYLTQSMSETLADSHIENYIMERDGELYLRETEFPTFINTNEAYLTEEIDKDTYHAIQEQDTELTNHIEITYIIQNQQNQWIVEDVDVQSLEQNSVKIESDQQAKEEVKKALQLSDQYQLDYEGQDVPSEEYEGQNLALIHVYEENENATATYGWYYINLENRAIYEYDIATNNLTLMYDYNGEEYVKVE
ncbi:hypothetical protein [Piscibacillus halophilus]|uniref:Uncharacterized protein n=1 Tax=Piscibacillus halophilus TaxID=571933 RepID=A0A1H9GS02_9BACI|nr:hypothetical protein [Piscibacillus halophilus]SEQ52789.1 hypothetical protein SAMN05216362_11641 [Piscibacillus halophilus]